MTDSGDTTHISGIIERRYSRRSVLKGLGAGFLASQLPFKLQARSSASISTLGFTEVERVLDERLHLVQGYHAQILMRWGDKVEANAPDFNPLRQSVTSQSKQFGTNNDFIAYFPMDGSRHGLLCVNHEYANPELMFEGGRKLEALSEDEHRICMESLGCSVIEIKQENGQWKPVYGEYNRRITATTPMRLSGPAAGDARMKTSRDGSGRRVSGTFANCAGGQTPWNTYLTCEENVDGFFVLNGYEGEESASHALMTIGQKPYHRWDLVDKRFSVADEPNEPNRFGWVVEIDPFKPRSTPMKRTALGRFKHEAATPVLNADGRVVVYSGDDAYDEHIYRFVSRERYQPNSDSHNSTLLDNGTLYVARFAEDGTVAWLPLVYGHEPLTGKNGFHSQADVLIEARRAAKLLDATPMDRPEDVDVNSVTGRVYAVMTKNPKRETTDHVNRRAPNTMGYILEMIPPRDDKGFNHAASHFKWELFLEGGNPNASDHEKGTYGKQVSEKGWLACPDNVAFDPKGRIWIATDGQTSALGEADGLYAADTTGEGRASTKCFMRAPKGAEVCGPCFTPDGKTLFISVQHPAESSDFDDPSTRWPDFDSAMPPRSAVIAITKDDGREIGG